MHEFKVYLTYATHHVFADDYSVSGGLYLFWIGTEVVRSFPVNDVERVELLS